MVRDAGVVQFGAFFTSACGVGLYGARDDAEQRRASGKLPRGATNALPPRTTGSSKRSTAALQTRDPVDCDCQLRTDANKR